MFENQTSTNLQIRNVNRAGMSLRAAMFELPLPLYRFLTTFVES